MKLLNDDAARIAASRVVDPLKERGVDFLSVSDGQGEKLRVTKEEYQYFVTSKGPEETITDTEFELAFHIARLSFNEANLWRLAADGFVISAAIKDEDFWASIHNNTAEFAEGDTLFCRVSALCIVSTFGTADGELRSDN